MSRAQANLRVLEVLDRLDTDGGAPTPGDLADLAMWSGWGPMARAMDPRITEAPWGELGDRVRHLLRPEDADEAEAATPNAFYTPPIVTAAAWKVLLDLGFAGGAVLEPGCGHGCFIAAAPPHLDVRWTGVERDPTTARIAGLLHPGARIVNRPLEKIALPPASFDAVVGNVPFANVTPYDPAAPFTLRLHNYFLWRSLDALRPGGVAVLVTSRFTMDATGGSEQRRHFADMAELLGAVRLPSGWEADYGTSAVADMLVFRKRTPGSDRRWTSWSVSDRPRDEKGDAKGEVAVNGHFRDHPGRVLGEMYEKPGASGGSTLGVRFAGGREELAAALGAALDEVATVALDRDLGWVPPAERADPVPRDLAAKGMAQGRFEVHEGGRLVKFDDGRWTPVLKDRGEIMQLIRVRDAAVALMESEADLDAPDADELRRALNRAYDAYFERFGPLNRATTYVGQIDPETDLPKITRRRPAALSAFRSDPDYPRILALEEWDDEDDVGVKAAIMRGRVNRRPERATHTDNPAEAVALSVDECARLDEAVVARVMGVDSADVEAVLGDLAYRDPESGELLSADEYLSGNVRARLTDALAAAAGDPRWQRNVDALRPVVPDDLGPDDIKVRLSAHWVPTDVVKDFVEETVKSSEVDREPIARVDHQPSMALWAVEVTSGQRKSVAATVTWGTEKADAYQLVQWALNGAPPVVYDYVEVDGKMRQVRNVEETALADQKTVELQARFREWIWEDPLRTDRLVRIYNDLFNSSVLRPYDGRHLTFPGLASDITPHPHQLDMVLRAMLTPATLCGLPVGSGKTGIIALAAIKLRALGLARKPVAAVPGHLLEQTAREMLRWFPGAKILMAGSKDLEGHKRWLFAARCATGDWDLVVLTHEAFKSLGIDQAVEQEYFQERIRRYRQALLDAADPRDRTVKQIAKAVDAMDARLQELMDRPRDPGVKFGDLGVDFVFYDEAHAAKNLGTPCRTPGLSASKASARATDVHMKLWWLAGRRKGGRHAMLLTGTPVSNSLAEIYVLQLYLQPDRLAELGVDDINAWAALHVESETKVEVSPDGGTFRLYTRPSRFLNVPDLRRTLAEVADIRAAEQLGLEYPEVVTENVVNEASEVQVRFTGEIVRRIDDIQDPTVWVDPKEDNMLKVCTDGRLCALDPSLVGLEDDEPGKADMVAAKVLELWRAHGGPTEPEPYPDVLKAADPGQLDIFAWVEREEARLRQEGVGDPPLQVVFSDIGTPRPGNAQVYGRIRAALVAGGMDPRRVRFVQDAKTDQAKAALFADCRSGRVDVLMGSTSGLGLGVNIQHRLLAIHQVDPPWRPDGVAQRLGRARRPGNRYRTVYEYRYLTEGSFDAYMWQTLERKLKFILQVLTGDLTAREVPDVGDVVLSYTEAKAIATGNSYLMELAEVDGAIAKYGRLHRAHQRDVRRLEWDAQRERRAAEHDEERARRLAELAYRAQQAPPGMKVEGRWARVTDRTEIGTALAVAFVGVMTGKGAKRLVGAYCGAELRVVASRAHKAWDLTLALDVPNTPGWSLRVDESWLAKGQVWRLAAVVEQFADAAPEEERRARAQAVDAREAARRLDKEADRPFAYAAELAAAEARKEAIEREMRREAMERQQQQGEAA